MLSLVRWKLQNWLGFKTSETKPEADKYFRVYGTDSAVVFVHGFSGRSGETWSILADALLKDDALKEWDLVSLGYPTDLRIDIPNVWTADPGIDLLSEGLLTAFSTPPLRDYKRIALIAHSMGGLVAQHAIVSSDVFRARVSHFIMFATPSAGLRKAGLLRAAKRQFRDMDADGEFIRVLRAKWAQCFASGTPFVFRAVAGDKDEFVPSSSSITPFLRNQIEVTPGNHISIIKPSNGDSRIVELLRMFLTGERPRHTLLETALIDAELGNFQIVVGNLWDLYTCLTQPSGHGIRGHEQDPARPSHLRHAVADDGGVSR